MAVWEDTRKFSNGITERQFRDLRSLLAINDAGKAERADRNYYHHSRVAKYLRNKWVEIRDNLFYVTDAGRKIINETTIERDKLGEIESKFWGCPKNDTPELIVWQLNRAFGCELIKLHEANS